MQHVCNYYPTLPSLTPSAFTSKFGGLPPKAKLPGFSHSTPFSSSSVLYPLSQTNFLFRIWHCFFIGKEIGCFRPGKLEKRNPSTPFFISSFFFRSSHPMLGFSVLGLVYSGQRKSKLFLPWFIFEASLAHLDI